jgi:hypothetical protein
MRIFCGYDIGTYGQGPKGPHRDPSGPLIQLTTVSIEDAHCSSNIGASVDYGNFDPIQQIGLHNP